MKEVDENDSVSILMVGFVLAVLSHRILLPATTYRTVNKFCIVSTIQIVQPS